MLHFEHGQRLSSLQCNGHICLSVGLHFFSQSKAVKQQLQLVLAACFQLWDVFWDVLWDVPWDVVWDVPFPGPRGEQRAEDRLRQHGW